MDRYTYSPLNDPHEIRVLVLEPSTNRTDPLRGTMKNMRLSAHERPYTHGSSFESYHKQWVHTGSGPSFRCVRRVYEVNTYDALSYTWGSHEKGAEIRIGMQEVLPIGENLMMALLAFRDTIRTRIIWIDAICINQADVKERNHQVHIMQRIYSQAASVVVWLGVANNMSRSALDLIIEQNGDFPGKTLLNCEEDALRGLRDVFLRSWWKRIWIVQEAVAACELVVFCGSHVVPWDFFSKVSHSIKWFEFSPMPKSRLLRRSGYGNFTALDDFRKERCSLVKYLRCTKDYEASDMRDKLYALIGVAFDITPEDIVPDYAKSARTVFIDLVRFFVTRRRSLDILCYGRLLQSDLAVALGSGAEPSNSTPSWLPDWSDSKSLRPLGSEGLGNTYYTASGDENAVVRMDAFPFALDVEGIVVDVIEFHTSNVPSARDTLPILIGWMNFVSKRTRGVSEMVTPPEFWSTLVAGKISGASFTKDGRTTLLADVLEPGLRSYLSGYPSQDLSITNYVSSVVTRAVLGRELFITAKKRMGLGVPGIGWYDRVVVLKGCSVPLVLTAREDHMVIVCEAYVSGIMNGEVIRDLARGKYQTTMIRLQ